MGAELEFLEGVECGVRGRASFKDILFHWTHVASTCAVALPAYWFCFFFFFSTVTELASWASFAALLLGTPEPVHALPIPRNILVFSLGAALTLTNLDPVISR